MTKLLKMLFSVQTCEGMLITCKLYSRGGAVTLHPLGGNFCHVYHRLCIESISSPPLSKQTLKESSDPSWRGIGCYQVVFVVFLYLFAAVLSHALPGVFVLLCASTSALQVLVPCLFLACKLGSQTFLPCIHM